MTPARIFATEIAPGDALDPDGRVRVTLTYQLPATGRVYVRVTYHGSRVAGVRTYGQNQPVKVWRP